MGAIIFIVIVCGIIYWGTGELKRKAEGAKNFIMGERGHCVDCIHCVYDQSQRFSSTNYFCRLSKCTNITDETVMDCMEMTTVTEEDLDEFMKLDLWTPEGCVYIRESLLGKKMGWTGVNEFMTRLPQEHPEYMKRTEV